MERFDSRIGVVTTVRATRRKTGHGWGQRPPMFFCQMAEHAAKLRTEFTMFAPDDVHWGNGTVRAWVPQDPQKPYGSWERKLCPIPDVLYENVYVHLAMKGFAVGLRQEAKKRGIPVFNPPLPGKWMLDQWLRKTDLSRYLPPTKRLGDVQLAMEQIRRWGQAYVKPIGGYGGAGVTRIEVLGANRYRVSVDRSAKGVTRKERFEVASDQLRRLLGRRKLVPHLVQQGLDLMTVKGRKVDFRVVVHRDAQGEWHVVGVVPKLAAVDGVVTNLIAGGEKLSLQDVVLLAAAEHKQIPVVKIEECALNIAERISRSYSYAGLIGFDLGVDKSGRVWMIEANPKPARSLLTPDMRKLAARYSTEFAVYLARRQRRLGRGMQAVSAVAGAGEEQGTSGTQRKRPVRRTSERRSGKVSGRNIQTGGEPSTWTVGAPGSWQVNEVDRGNVSGPVHWQESGANSWPWTPWTPRTPREPVNRFDREYGDRHENGIVQTGFGSNRDEIQLQEVSKAEGRETGVTNPSGILLLSRK